MNSVVSPQPAAPSFATTLSSGLPVAIIGGGITGLSTAWYLRKLGVPVVVFEAKGQPGGVMASRREGDWLLETGPNTLFENSAAISDFLRGVGLENRRLVASPEANTRYVVRHGRPAALPATPLQFFTSPFLSVRTKLGVLAEPFRGRGPAEIDESVANFVTRRLGQEFLDFVVNPFVAGVYAGDPGALSPRVRCDGWLPGQKIRRNSWCAWFAGFGSRPVSQESAHPAPRRLPNTVQFLRIPPGPDPNCKAGSPNPAGRLPNAAPPPARWNLAGPRRDGPSGCSDPARVAEW